VPDASRQPTLATVPGSIFPGTALVATGAGFRPKLEGSGGGTNSSATNFPLLQVMRVDNGQTLWLPVNAIVGFSDTSFTATATAFAGFPYGHALVTAFVNGIPSAAKLLVYSATQPTVTGIAPASGPTAGGTAVTITGTNLTDASAVSIGGTSATGISVVNATTITATTPAGAAGAQNVVVSTPGGAGTGVGLFTYFAVPTVTGIAPAYGPLAGGTSVTITGTHFTGVTGATIGGAAVTGMTVVSATTITATTPAGIASAQDVVITTPGGAGTGTGLFTYIARILDIDGTGSCDALSDGLLIIRSLSGLSGPALINGAIGPGASRPTAALISSYLTAIRPALDIDGNGQFDASTDGLLIIRYLFGLRGNALTAGAFDPLGTRVTAPAIEAYLDSLIQPLLP